MPESLLQYLLGLLDVIEEPVVLASALERFSLPAALRLIEEGVLRQTSDAEEIIRPKRFGPPITVVVRKTASGIWGVPEEDEYYESVKLTDDDIRLYEISIRCLVEKIRRENAISGNGFEPDRGLIHVGERLSEGEAFDVYLTFCNHDADTLLGRMRRLNAGQNPVVVLTPTPAQPRTEHRRLLADDGVILTALSPLAEDNSLAVDWNRMKPGNRVQPQPSVAVGMKLKRTVGSPEAVEAIKSYIQARVWDLTEFSVQAGVTDRTLRSFFETGKMQRGNFKTMAESIGVTPEQLLRGELPDTIKRPTPR